MPPEEMAKGLAVMMPAMNIDDRATLLGGMRAGAPAEVFQGVWSLVGSVLEVDDRQALAHRLDIATAQPRTVACVRAARRSSTTAASARGA